MAAMAYNQASYLKALLTGLPDCVLLPLYLYDHSGLTISTSPFGDPWDSGQVGYIFAGAKAIRGEYGTADQTAVAKAEQVLQAEVEEYDSYLRGDCWYVRLFEDGEEIDACGGFIGELQQCGITDLLPEAAKHLVGELEWLDDEEAKALIA